MPAPPTWRAKASASAPPTREDAQEDAVKKMFTPEFRNRLDAIVPFAYLPPAVVAASSTSSSSSSSCSSPTAASTSTSTRKRAQWLIDRGYDKLYGARPMGRLVQEKIKQPLAEELLFGKLVNGGEVKVRIKDNAPAFETMPAPPKASKKPRPRPSAPKASDGTAAVRGSSMGRLVR